VRLLVWNFHVVTGLLEKQDRLFDVVSVLSIPINARQKNTKEKVHQKKLKLQLGKTNFALGCHEKISAEKPTDVVSKLPSSMEPECRPEILGHAVEFVKQ